MTSDELYFLDMTRKNKTRGDFRAEPRAANDNHPDDERGAILAELARLKAEFESDRNMVARDERVNRRPAELLRRQLRDVIHGY
jgi:hypothetical protein